MATTNLVSTKSGKLVLQTGNGTPDHIATIGTIYMDLDVGTEYINKDGISLWAEQATSNSAAFELIANKQNSMDYDGTGVKYPTVDAVNKQTNDLARAVIKTGFVDVEDTFTLYKYNDNTLGISGTSVGIVFSNLFDSPPITPSSAIVQLSSRTVPLSNIGLTGDTNAVKFVGYRQSDDSILFSNTTFIQSQTVCQLGIVLVKYSAGTHSFVDNERTFINQPDISSYSNLSITSIGLKSNVIVANNANNLRIRNTSGTLIGISVNWHGPNNDLLPITGNEPTGTTFTYINPGTSITSTPATTAFLIDPTQYWDGTALVSPGNNNSATIQRFLVTVRGTIVVQYGETAYSNFADALSNATIEQFTDVLPAGTAVEVGRVVVAKGATDLSDNTKAHFIQTGGGSGGAGGGGGGSSTWGGITGNIFDQSDLVANFQPILGYTAENITNKVNVISGTSSTEYPTENAVVNFVNNNLSPVVKNEFIYTSGPQTFTLSQNYGQVWAVTVQGGGPLKNDQYVLSGGNKVTITDTLDSGDYIIVLFTAVNAGVFPYYTQAEVDILLNLKMDKQRQTKIISSTTYDLISSDSDKILYFTSPSAITMTISSGLTLGNSYEVFQQGTGQITFSGAGTTIRYSSQELPMTSERYALVGIDSIANVTEEYHLYGQLYAI